MKYRLYNKEQKKNFSLIEQVLYNRGVEDPNSYLNLDDSALIPYYKLDNISEAVELLTEHASRNHNISILVDSDPDGYCSAAMFYLYMKRAYKDCKLKYILHGRPKAHGLTEDVIIPSETDLLIIPDAGTNDIEQCKTLSEKMDIIILDHHEKEKENPYAVIVNNQCSPQYTNKNLCGAGIVYKFLLALDDWLWNDFADDYLDLCALANISDSMDIREHETRYLIKKGLTNIQNKFFLAILKAQEYSTKGIVNINNIQWYVTPILNGCIRIGSLEEKEILFKAFVERDEVFEYKKRATKDKPAETIEENIYDRAARLSKNAKSRQDKLRDKSTNAIIEIANKRPDTDKVVVVDATEVLDDGLTGVVAIKIAEKFNKPCILLRKHTDNKSGKVSYGGSARNIDNSPIESFKDVVNQCGSFTYGQGHPNAFGVGLEIGQIENAITSLNKYLDDVEYDATYLVDSILDIDAVTISSILDYAKFDDYIGQKIDEVKVAVENINLAKNCFSIYGKTEDTISFVVGDIKYIMFRCKDGNELYDWLQNAWNDEESITFNIVGKPGINEFNGIRTPQITIEDINVVKIENGTKEDYDDEW